MIFDPEGDAEWERVASNPDNLIISPALRDLLPGLEPEAEAVVSPLNLLPCSVAARLAERPAAQAPAVASPLSSPPCSAAALAEGLAVGTLAACPPSLRPCSAVELQVALLLAERPPVARLVAREAFRPRSRCSRRLSL